MAKSNSKDNAKRVLAIPDVHYPLHDQRALSCLERFMGDFKPDVVVYIGDLMQMDSVSHWLADKRRSLEGQRLLRDYEGTNTILDRHQGIAPNAKFVFIVGNHEDWVRQYIDLHPEMEGLLEVDRCLRLRERHFDIVSFGSSYKVGKLWYMHGVYTNEHHSKSTVMAFQRNVRYGHTHDIQQYTWMSPVDQDSRHSASSIGCLCNVNPHYMKHKPNRWMHGFNVAYIRTDGTFTDYTVPIVKGKLTFEGKTYAG